MAESVQDLKKKRDKLKAIQKLKDGLPHLYSFDMYPWQEEFWVCPATFQFIFKANQIGGSSVMIKRIIHYATEQKLWGRFKRRPTQMMYLYPVKKSATREWQGKWSEFMPRGEFKDDDEYGWKENWDGPYIDNIEFKSGVTLYFKTYASGAETLQASTPAIIACDEELPFDLWPELQMRIASPANAGAMYWQGCTPTLGQDYLARIQDGRTKLPDSWVKTVSMYDCLKLASGKPSIWSIEKIRQIEQTLPNEKEIEVRVHGRFKKLEGLAITQFDSKRHIKPYHMIKGWDWYAGIDYGAGGTHGHPSAISIVAVSPDYTAARLMKFWRGDGESTTPDDVILKFLEMKQSLGIIDMAGIYYDHSAAAIGITATRQGLGFEKADKNRELGYGLLNSLFKNDMLILFDDGTGQVDKLATEMDSLGVNEDKKRAKDDGIDSIRYAISSIPFNFENIKVSDPEKISPTKRVGRHEVVENEYDMDELGDEIDEWNEYYG